MLRASKYFRLGRSQPELDFVDIDVVGDVAVYIDPLALRPLTSDWARDCVGLLQSFFDAVITAIRDRNITAAASLLSHLSEPNETHLGLSQGPARGRGVGRGYGYDLAHAISKSEAIESGLLSDLEDTILMVEGVSFDLISDMTTNIIREPLIRYTQAVCAQYRIRTTPDVWVGWIWDPAGRAWGTEVFEVPMVRGRPLLFVPKSIVRRRLQYDQDEYFRYFLVPFLQDEEITAKTSLVKTIKGAPHVYKKDVEAKYAKKYGPKKRMIVRLSSEHPELLKRYKDAKRENAQVALEHEDLATLVHGRPPDWDRLLSAVTGVPAGAHGANAYHKAVAGLLAALFYPSLTDPRAEYPIHDGRKRIDIAYVNDARDGFFHWLSVHYRAPHIFVECKNYIGDPGNPELDQLTGRFSPQRGHVGILACRSFDNKGLFIERCKDTAKDQRGFVIPIDDSDLNELVNAAKMLDQRRQFRLLKARFDSLIN